MSKRGASNTKSSPRKAFPLWQRLISVFVVLSLLVAAAGGVKMLYSFVNNQKFEYLRMEGEFNQVTEEEIRQAVGEMAGKSLVRLDLEAIKRQIENHPWVKSAQVSRQWPNAIMVTVSEQNAIARWKGGSLLNARGEVFRPVNHRPEHFLPQLTGPDGTANKVMEQYQQFNRLLYPSGFRITALELDNRDSWSFRLENGVLVKVGKKHITERVRRLVTLLDSYLFDPKADIESMDLRYSNGIAVKHQNSNHEDVVSL